MSTINKYILNLTTWTVVPSVRQKAESCTKPL